MSESKCGCKFCKRHRRVEVVRSHMTSLQLKVFTEIYDELVHAEFDRDYYKAIADGTWPGADGTIERMRGNTNSIIAPQLGVCGEQNVS